MAREGMGDIVLIDNWPGLAAGKAEDIRQSLALTTSPVHITGGDDPALCAGAGLVVITAGIPRKAGLSREDLLRGHLKKPSRTRSWRKPADGAQGAPAANPRDISSR